MAEERRIYQAIDPVTNDDAEAVLVRNDPDELLLVAIAVGMYSDDLTWSEDFCLRLAEHPHVNVRGNAILSFGHLARRFGTLEKPESVTPSAAVWQTLMSTFGAKQNLQRMM